MASYIRNLIPSVSCALRLGVAVTVQRLHTISSLYGSHSLTSQSVMVMQTRNFAARKGTRDKKLKLKKARKLLLQARAAQKGTTGSHASGRSKASKAQLASRVRTSLDLTKQGRTTQDDVWLAFMYKRQLNDLKEAIEMHRETHHPTVMNLPNAPLFLSLELDISLEKKNKYLENINGVVRPPHFFDDGKTKSVIAFCKDDEGQQQAMDAGADMVGGLQLIKRVQGGEALLADYKYIVCHPNILLDLGPLRAIMKKRFPNVAKGTVGANMKELVQHFKKGIQFASERDNVQQDFGWVDVQVGELSMTSEQIESNVKEIVGAISLQGPVKSGPFVTVAVLTCPPSKEKILVDVSQFLPNRAQDDEADEDVGEQIKRKKN